MKTLKWVSLFVTFVLFTSLAITPAIAQEDDDEERERSDNKILVTGVPLGWAVKIVQPDAGFPSGPGNSPDNAGTVTAYAPLNKLSYVYLWNGVSNNVIATINPTSTYPDTVIGASLQFAQGLPSQGMAAPMIPGQFYPSTQAAPSTIGRQHVVQAGDTLAKIAQQYGKSVADLAAANPNLLLPGQVLTIP